MCRQHHQHRSTGVPYNGGVLGGAGGWLVYHRRLPAHPRASSASRAGCICGSHSPSCIAQASWRTARQLFLHLQIRWTTTQQHIQVNRALVQPSTYSSAYPLQNLEGLSDHHAQGQRSDDIEGGNIVVTRDITLEHEQVAQA